MTQQAASPEMVTRPRVHQYHLPVRALWITSLGLVVLLLVGQLVQNARTPRGFYDSGLAAVAFIVVGGAILPRHPGHRVGRLFVTIGLISAVATVSLSFSEFRFAAWLSKWAPFLAYGLMPASLLLFPDGNLPARRWRPVMSMIAVGTFATVTGVALAAWIEPRLFLVPDAQHAPQATGAIMLARLGTVIIFGGTVGAVFSLVARWRRARGIARQQLKLLAIAAALIAIGFLAEALGVAWASLITLPAAPVAAGVAILRYRLYDVDLFLNRSLVYLTLTLLLLGAYFGLVALLGLLFTERTPVGPLVAAGAVALLVEPLRRRLQRGAGRLLYGARDDPYAVVSRLGRRLERSVDPSGVLPDVTRTVAETLQLPYAAIEVVGTDGPHVVAGWGRRFVEPEGFPMTYQGRVVGVLLVTPRSPTDAFTASERELLEDLARQAGLAVHAARLTSDLQRSRERLVRSREEERRRLRRDLHDGLGPTLAGLTMRVGAARTLTSAHDTQVDEALDGLEQGLQSCVQEIRRLVDDLRPPALEQLGLIEAIRHGVRAFQAPEITVEAPAELGELPAAVEVAAFRIATEAVTNTARHAHAERCDVRLTLQQETTLVIEIIDDGVGLPPHYQPGVGITSMRERVEELGGTFLAEQPAAGGTRICAELPLGP